MELRIRDVSKRYGARWALAHIDLTFASGEAVMLAGHNGSGKTTLLRLIAGALPPTLGDLELGGFSVRKAREKFRRHVALLSHASGHYEDLSARENLHIHASLLGKDEKSVSGVLDRVGLAARQHTTVREFSAGMKKRLAVARVMLKAPELILLDEPFGELDPQGMQVVELWIGEEKRAGRTVILATHWLEQGARLTDRTVTLEGGRLPKLDAALAQT
jgi:heme exporter protein A